MPKVTLRERVAGLAKEARSAAADLDELTAFVDPTRESIEDLRKRMRRIAAELRDAADKAEGRDA